MKRRAALLAVLLVGAAACDRVDAQKFEAVQRAGAILNQDVHRSEPARATDWLSKFQTEITVLRTRAREGRETQALNAYAAAAEAYDKLITYRLIEGKDGRVALNDEPARRDAAKFNLAVQRTDGNAWVDGKDAIRRLHAYAETKFEEANAIVNR